MELSLFLSKNKPVLVSNLIFVITSSSTFWKSPGSKNLWFRAIENWRFWKSSESKNLQFQVCDENFQKKTKPLVLGFSEKISKHPVSFMKELTKNLQFRAGSLTGSLVSWEPGLRVMPSSLIFWEPLVKGPDTWPLPTGTFFEKERTTKHWNILYTGKEAHGIVAPCAKSSHCGPFPQWHDRMQSRICGQEVADHFAS